MPMQLLFVENDDSFSWNVVDALPFARSDIRMESGSDGAAVATALGVCDAVVIGPGPTDPVRAGLVELVRTVAERKTPLLGICLGHQAIGLAFGARLQPTVPCHGKQASFGLTGRFFGAFQEPTVAMRYHSLALVDVRSPLRTTATTADGIVMAVEHETLPIAGLQFHPDSYATPRGREMLAAFFKASCG
jgi:anthranilate synthase/aminodeoxychorismate synthase-like glutamine amidotransferase